MRELLLPILFTVVFVGALGVIGYQYGLPYITPYLENTVESMIVGDTPVNVVVADTPKERERGLSGRPALAPDEGLLLVFEESDFHGIWMKDMNFSIDVIWIDESLRVVDITSTLSPETYPSIFEPRVPARMALEVNAAFAASHEIKVGDRVRLNDAYIPEDLKNR